MRYCTSLFARAGYNTDKILAQDKKLSPPVLAQPMISVSKEELREELFRLAKEIGLILSTWTEIGIKMFTHQILGVINRDSYTEITELTKQIELLASASSEEILNDHFNRLVELAWQALIAIAN